MGNIVERPETGNLYFDFRYGGKRCREQMSLPANAANRKRLEKVLLKIEAEITLGTFEYGKYFPNSPRAEALSTKAIKNKGDYRESPLFSDFAETWFGEMRVQWRASHAKTFRGTLDTYLLPTFNGQEFNRRDALARLGRKPGVDRPANGPHHH